MKRSAENPAEGIRRLYRPGDKEHKPTGRYQARYTVKINGKTVQKSAGTFASLADAKDARSVQLAKLKTGGWVDPLGPRTTVATWAQEYEQLRRGGNTKTKAMLRRVVAFWGERRLGDITSIEVQQWVNGMVAEPLAPATVKAVYTCFRQMMEFAVDHEVLGLGKSPCRRIELPAQKHKKPVPLSLAQLALLEAKAPDRYRAMIHLGAWAGLRWGELAALRWEDIDLEGGVIHVQRGVTVERTVGPTKNGKDRFVKVAPETVEVLRAHRRDFGDKEWVFTTAKTGVRLGYADFRAGVWLPLVKACEISPAPTFHSLRHAHAGHMVMRGMDWKVLSERLGHHAPSFTADVYGWRRPDSDEVTVAAIQAAMQGDR